MAVKSAKRALRDNTGDDRKLDGDEFMRSLLVLRNTPDRDTGMSPAQLLLGRPLRGVMPYHRLEQITEPDSQVA